MTNCNKTLVTVYYAINANGCPSYYRGVIELATSGCTDVIIQVPRGCEKFPNIPFFAYVPCANTFVLFPEDEGYIANGGFARKPVVIVTEWENI